MFKDWLIDATKHTPGGIVCFIPYDKETHEVTFGMSVVSDECPGNLLGVLHMDGDEAVNEWIKNNPDWKEKYKQRN